MDIQELFLAELEHEGFEQQLSQMIFGFPLTEVGNGLFHSLSQGTLEEKQLKEWRLILNLILDMFFLR